MASNPTTLGIMIRSPTVGLEKSIRTPTGRPQPRNGGMPPRALHRQKRLPPPFVSAQTRDKFRVPRKSCFPDDRLLLAARQRDRAGDGKGANPVNLGKKESRSREDAAAGGAAKLAGASGDCISAVEDNSPIHINRAPNRNHESQYNSISVLASQRISRAAAAVDYVLDLVVRVGSGPPHISGLAPSLHCDVENRKLQYRLDLRDEVCVKRHFVTRPCCLRRETQEGNSRQR
jgi:hypothetical protein